ncbi:MAG: U2 snRNP-associated SURP domain-containing protein [Marteilia pararefringens]
MLFEKGDPKKSDASCATPKLIRKTSKPPARKSNLQGFIEEISEKKSIGQKKAEIQQFVDQKFPKSFKENECQGKPSTASSQIPDNNPSNADYIESNNLYVGNIPNTMSEKSLCWLFSHYGPLFSMKKIQQEPKYYKTYAFVAYFEKEHALKALHKLNGYNFQGCELRIKWGKPQPVQSKKDYCVAFNDCEKFLIRHCLPHAKHSDLPFKSIKMKSKYSIGQVKPFIFEDCDALSDPEEFSDYFDDASAEENSIGQNSKDDSDYSSSSRSSRSSIDYNEDPGNSDGLVESTGKDWSRELRLVKVIVPHNRRRLQLINRTAQFVAHGGPVFEALLMNNERGNPEFKFMIDFSTMEHLYYRWRLFSLLNGDSFHTWRTEPFYFYSSDPIVPEESSILIIPPTSRSMIEESRSKESKNRELLAGDAISSDPKKYGDDNNVNSAKTSKIHPDFQIADGDIVVMSRGLQYKLLKILARITPDRYIIGKSMMWAIMNADCSYNILSLLTKFVLEKKSSLSQKIATFYLIFDIIMNCSVKMPNAFKYRKVSMVFLPIICSHFSQIIAHEIDKSLSKSIMNRLLMCFEQFEQENVFNGIYTKSLMQILARQRSFNIDRLEDINEAAYSSLMNPFAYEKVPPSIPIDDEKSENKLQTDVSFASTGDKNESDRPVLIANIYDDYSDTNSSPPVLLNRHNNSISSDCDDESIDGTPLLSANAAVDHHPAAKPASFTNHGFTEANWQDSSKSAQIENIAGQGDNQSIIEDKDSSVLETSKWNNLEIITNDVSDDDDDDEDIDGIPM